MSASVPGLHSCSYDHYFQVSFSLKPLAQSKPNFMKSHLGKREHKLYDKRLGNITKQAVITIYDKNLLSRTGSLMNLKHGIQHREARTVQCVYK